MVPKPHYHAFSWHSRNGRSFVQVPKLLTLILQGKIHFRHPFLHRTILAGTFMAEATTTSNDNSFG
ncbi:MAG: hypothetical protein OIF58_14360, partial [Cohaesibacter sp.]|nr:hypothetical protein [Cohaesibacter sp.]